MRSGVEQGCKDFRGLLRRAKIIQAKSFGVGGGGGASNEYTREEDNDSGFVALYGDVGWTGWKVRNCNLCSLEKGNIEKTVLLSLKTRTHDETLVENSACCECGRAKISFFSMGVESTTGGEKWVWILDACWLFRSKAAVVVALMTRHLEQSVLVTGTCF